MLLLLLLYMWFLKSLVDVPQPKTPRNIPAVEQLDLLLIEVRENTQQEDPWVSQQVGVIKYWGLYEMMWGTGQKNRVCSRLHAVILQSGRYLTPSFQGVGMKWGKEAGSWLLAWTGAVWSFLYFRQSSSFCLDSDMIMERCRFCLDPSGSQSGLVWVQCSDNVFLFHRRTSQPAAMPVLPCQGLAYLSQALLNVLSSPEKPKQ